MELPDSAGLSTLRVRRPAVAELPALRKSWIVPIALVAIAAVAAGLRLTFLGAVPGNPFYDAAVRTMEVSWHAFLFGALDPSGGVSVDKPPVDLWLQVASVKLFGFNGTALKLPQALAGAAAVVVLFDLVRRPFGTAAGLGAAAALAVLPVAVLTARSDTMDTVMVFLVLLATWFVVRALETQRLPWLLAAGVTIGLAFNVKLFQALLPLPAIALLWFAGSRMRPRRTILTAAAAVLVGVVVCLAWIVPVALTPRDQRPYPIGSTNGSVWNLVFVFNGIDRLHGRPLNTVDTLPAGSHVSTAIARAQQQRTSHAATTGFARLMGRRFVKPVGSELFPALCVLLAGALLAVVMLIRRGRRAFDGQRLGVALVLSLAVWMVLGTQIFNSMQRLHLRYIDTISPAIAAILGGGLVLLVTRGGRLGRLLAAAVAVATGFYVQSLAPVLGPSAHWELAACLVAALVLVALAVPRNVPRWAGVAAAALGLAALLVAPAAASLNYVHTRSFDAQRSGAMPPELPPRIDRYLNAHRNGAHYLLASISPAKAAPLIAYRPQPVLMLTSYRSQPLVSVARLGRLVRRNQVHYFLIGRRCTSALTRATAACPATAHWVIAHGTDVSRAAGLRNHGVLWRVRL